jgi:hypothetical protein
MGSEAPASRVVEPEVPSRVTAGPPPSLVDQAVVEPAQQHEVVEVRGPPVGPVDQVVGVEPPLVLAPWEPAGAVSVPEGSADGPGDHPAPPTDPHRAAA